MLRTRLPGYGHTLRLFDRVPVPDAPEAVTAELADHAALRAALRGCDAVVHLAGIPVESSFETILRANVEGTYRLYEAARAEGVRRVVYASSNHAVGFTPRPDDGSGAVPAATPHRPDTFYGLSKCFGEDLAAVLGPARRRDRGDQVSVTPGLSLRASKITYGPTSETGGGPALTYQRESTTAIESRFGVVVAGLSPTFRPYGSVAWVHGLADTASSFGANFVGGVGPDAVFALGSDDRDWAEVGVGLEAIQNNWRFTVAAETTLGRDDVETQSYRAAATIRF